MNKQFVIITAKGDKLKVSLSSCYESLTDTIIKSKHIPFDIIEISIEGNPTNGPVTIETFNNIAKWVIECIDKEPDTILFYFCDCKTPIPNIRPSKDLLPAQYRNDLFSLLFRRYVPLSSDMWVDETLVFGEDDPYIFHILHRESHSTLINDIAIELETTLNIITEQK